MKRAQEQAIIKDLQKKMVFITGPRQVGKTYLARVIAEQFPNSVYLNYDNFQDRDIIRDLAWLEDTDLLVLDELHKMPAWKNYLKGLYDTKPENLKILVTGSARLETFSQSGDSLAGRFFRHRLNPFSLSELRDDSTKNFEKLMKRGGFPEPFLAETDQDADRWRLQYMDGLIRTDILDFENIHDFKAMQILLELLRERIGSPLSYSSLARDITCSPNTVKRYIAILEALFIIFRVTPYHRNIARSLLKEPKVYFYDTGMVKGNDRLRLENTVAVCLMKHLNAIEDYAGKRAELNYLRTKEKKEVDFILSVEDAPLTLIEVKLTDDSISPSLKYFQNKYGFLALQLVKNLRQERMADNITLRKAASFLGELKL